MKKSKVWIEFEKPESEEHAKELCEKMNKMMAKLGDMGTDKFFVNGHKGRWYLAWGGCNGFLELSDRGHWFSLDYLSK